MTGISENTLRILPVILELTPFEPNGDIISTNFICVAQKPKHNTDLVNPINSSKKNGVSRVNKICKMF